MSNSMLDPFDPQRQVRGLEFDPFCPNNLATGGGDGMVKVWSIPPEGLKEDLISPLVSINTGECGHRRFIVVDRIKK